ncbi:MAG: endonuclease III [Candidatus Aenigmatarchaeota archaeon]
MKSLEKKIPIVIRLMKHSIKKFKQPTVTKIANPFQVLVSCLLSLRTRDETTAKATKHLFSMSKTPQKMIKLSVKQIEKAIYPVGFYRVKAKRIKNICKILLEKYNGNVPDDFDELMKLKGIGRKTANIVMVYGFDKEGLPIDIHCHRIPNRLGWIKTKTPEHTERELKMILPKRYWHDFNDTFVTFGQNICKPVKPHCWECSVTKYCKYNKKK